MERKKKVETEEDSHKVVTHYNDCRYCITSMFRLRTVGHAKQRHRSQRARRDAVKHLLIPLGAYSNQGVKAPAVNQPNLPRKAFTHDAESPATSGAGTTATKAPRSLRASTRKEPMSAFPEDNRENRQRNERQTEIHLPKTHNDQREQQQPEPDRTVLRRRRGLPTCPRAQRRISGKRKQRPIERRKRNRRR